MSITATRSRGAANRSYAYSNVNITDSHVAALKAQQLLEDYYNRSEDSVETPYSGLIDGEIVGVSNPELRDGNYQVVAIGLKITHKEGVTQRLDLEGNYS